jgi:hypothetical protein
MQLLDKISELESWIDKKDFSNEKISQSSIGWQIAHSLKVANSIIKLLAKSNPDDYKWKFNFFRALCLKFRVFPRGKAKAPKAVNPQEDDICSDSLHELVLKVRTRLESVLNVHPNSFFEHAYFGKIKRDDAFLFMFVHTTHHLKIIKDIAG